MSNNRYSEAGLIADLNKKIATLQAENDTLKLNRDRANSALATAIMHGTNGEYLKLLESIVQLANNLYSGFFANKEAEDLAISDLVALLNTYDKVVAAREQAK